MIWFRHRGTWDARFTIILRDESDARTFVEHLKSLHLQRLELPLLQDPALHAGSGTRNVLVLMSSANADTVEAPEVDMAYVVHLTAAQIKEAIAFVEEMILRGPPGHNYIGSETGTELVLSYGEEPA
jgi:hypothetical protein